MNRANVGMPLHVSAKQMSRSDLDGSFKAKQVAIRMSEHGTEYTMVKPRRTRKDGIRILGADLFQRLIIFYRQDNASRRNIICSEQRQFAVDRLDSKAVPRGEWNIGRRQGRHLNERPGNPSSFPALDRGLENRPCAAIRALVESDASFRVGYRNSGMINSQAFSR